MLRRVLKKLGLVLILLPEPFTTPLGVVLLGAAYVFARFDRVDSARQLRGFMNLYFRHARPVGQTGKIIQHKLKQRLIDYEWRFQPRYIGEKTVHHSLRWADYVLPEPPRTIDAVQKTVIHKIDDSRLALRYSDMAGGSARGIIADKVIFHNLKSSLSGYVLPGKALVPEKIVHHTMVNTNLSPVSGRAW